MGHIDLLDTISYFEVPEKDAKKVTIQLTGIRYKGRTVRCNDADEKTLPHPLPVREGRNKPKDKKLAKGHTTPHPHREGQGGGSPTYKKDEWQKFLNPKSMKLKGEIPEFSEEGWAIRKPRKKK